MAFGTVDSWLMWNLTQGAEHVIEASNASRTMLMNLQTQAWDEELLQLFNIPISVLPKIIASDSYMADTATGLFGRQISPLREFWAISNLPCLDSPALKWVVQKIPMARVASCCSIPGDKVQL